MYAFTDDYAQCEIELKNVETFKVFSNSSLDTYSHSQWLFYKFVNKITNKLVKKIIESDCMLINH